jgi:hypothetical protein
VVLFSDTRESWLLRPCFLDYRIGCGLSADMASVVYVVLQDAGHELVTGDIGEYLETIKETPSKSLFKPFV